MFRSLRQGSQPLLVVRTGLIMAIPLYIKVKDAVLWGGVAPIDRVHASLVARDAAVNLIEVGT